MSKIYTADEAARAVLKKAEEMFKSSKLAKVEANTDSTVAMAEKDVTPADGVQAQGLPPAAPDHVNGNPQWGTEPGCHKLSKFMGRREERKKAKTAPVAAPAAVEGK